ncbi:50S ribosomal protein L10 [Candidatus Dependentiae bacterium]|nr:50S ribosomal protein L10 [Candidatus Dependentiae bacterium]
MNRNQKGVTIESLRESVKQSEGAILVNYQGMTVEKLQKLRTQLRQEGAVMKVAKARLMVRAIDGLADSEGFKSFLKNQVGLVFAKSNTPGVAKKLVDFAKDEQGFAVVSGLFEHKVWDKAGVEALAAIPSREVLLTQLANVLQAPIAGLARVLDKTAQKLAESK